MPEMLGVEWIWKAWNDLNSCRSLGMGVGPIPWSAVDRYAQAVGLDGDEFVLLWRCSMRLEKIYQDHLKEKSDRRAKKHGDSNRKTRR